MSEHNAESGGGVAVQRSVGQPALDMRSPLAKARDKWLESADGKSCCDPLTLKAPADARQYLENRLVSAWLAGAAWAERQYRNRRLPNEDLRHSAGSAASQPKETTNEK